MSSLCQPHLVFVKTQIVQGAHYYYFILFYFFFIRFRSLTGFARPKGLEHCNSITSRNDSVTFIWYAKQIIKTTVCQTDN